MLSAAVPGPAFHEGPKAADVKTSVRFFHVSALVLTFLFVLFQALVGLAFFNLIVMHCASIPGIAAPFPG